MTCIVTENTLSLISDVMVLRVGLQTVFSYYTVMSDRQFLVPTSSNEFSVHPPCMSAPSEPMPYCDTPFMIPLKTLL